MKAKKKSSRTVFRKIKKLYTLSGVRAKDGLHPLIEDLAPIEKAAMIVEGSTLVWVGEERRLKSALKAIEKEHGRAKVEETDLGAETVLPAFADPHTHLVFAGDRSDEFEMRNAGLSYQAIAQKGGGIRSTVKKTRAAKPQELLDLAQQRAERLVRQGVTTVEVKSGYGLNETDELKILQVAQKIHGPRVIGTFLGPHAVPEGQTADSYLEELIQTVLPKARRWARRADMFVESGYFSIPQARRYFEAASALGFELTVHADQLTRTGASVELARLSAQSVDHCVQISAADVQELARRSGQTTCVLLPTSDFYLKMVYPPARALIDAGARVALATDYNPGTSPSLDLSLTGVLARLQMQMTLPEVIVALTFNALRALGLTSQLGSLETGLCADFVTIEAPLEGLFYDVGYHPVRATYREGQKVDFLKS